MINNIKNYLCLFVCSLNSCKHTDSNIVKKTTTKNSKEHNCDVFQCKENTNKKLKKTQLWCVPVYCSKENTHKLCPLLFLEIVYSIKISLNVFNILLPLWVPLHIQPEQTCGWKTVLELIAADSSPAVMRQTLGSGLQNRFFLLRLE